MTGKRIGYQIGDRINQRGDHNIGVVRYRSASRSIRRRRYGTW